MNGSAMGAARLGLSAARAVALIGADAMGDRFARGLPRTPEELARPEVLSSLLGKEVGSARLAGDHFESSNCQNFLVEVEFTNGDVQSLFAKIPSRELAPRVFANAIGYWALECTFCRSVAPRVAVRVPGVSAVVQHGSRFVLLLENIRELPGARLFENRDMAAGTTPDQARRCLTAFAELHAGFQGWDSNAREEALPLVRHPHLPQRRRAVTRFLNVTAVDRAHRRLPNVFTAAHVSSCRRAFERWDELLDYWYQGDLTLVHGDSHLANCFEYGTPDGPRVGLLDFQAVHWSKGIRDVAYFLIHSLEAGVLAANEESLVDHYIAASAAHGVVLDPEATRAQYRSFSLQALMVGTVAVGLGGFTERESTVHTMLERELAAFERLDFAGWLDSLST